MIFWYYSELVTDWLRLLVVVMLLYGPECRAIWAIGHRVATTGGETTPIHETMTGEYLKNGRWRSLGKMVEVCCTSKHFQPSQGLRENAETAITCTWTCQKEEKGIPVVERRKKMHRCALVGKQ